MADTNRLALPYLAAAQSQKHVTHNEALRMLDALVQIAVLARDVNDPPSAPAEGDRVIVGSSPTGAFAGQAGRLAAFDDGAWRFFVPRAGWIALVGSGGLLVHDGSAWQDLGRFVHTLDGLDRIGIGTSGDSGNPLSAKLNTALFSARPAAEGGSGDLRMALSKPLPGGTLSLLFQSGWSGRAELGLVGDDGFRIRASADGNLWRDALVVDPASGSVRFPGGLAEAGGQALAPFRNHVVNGDFAVAQRGSGPFALAQAMSFGFDRWAVQASGAVAGTLSRTAFGTARRDVPGGRFYATWQVASLGAGARAEVQTRIEEAPRLAGRQVTVSLYYRTNAAGFVLELGQNVAGGAAAATVALSQPLSASASWRRFTATVTLPDLAAAAGPASFTLLRLATSQAGSIDVADVQLEEGAVATAFERRLPALDLLLCRRFFRRSAAALSPTDLAQEMRAVPAQSGTGPYDYSAEL